MRPRISLRGYACPSVCLSACQSVHNAFFFENAKTHDFDFEVEGVTSGGRRRKGGEGGGRGERGGGDEGGGEGGEEGGTHLTFGVTKLVINCLAVFDIYNNDKNK